MGVSFLDDTHLILADELVGCALNEFAVDR